MARLLIKNGVLWNGEEFSCGDVLVDGRYIVKIAREIVDEADFIFHADGKIVSPGLVDIHVHMRGIASEEFGMHVEMSSFPFGVTAVNDAGSTRGDRILLDSFSVKNTVFVGVDIRDNHAHFAYTEKMLQKYGDKAIGLKVYFDTSLNEVRDITPLKEICNYAKSKGLRVMVHCSNSPTTMAEIVSTLAKGDILTHAYHGGVNTCTEEEFACFRIAKERGVIIDAGFAGHIHTDFQNLKNAIEAGYLPDTISTDITRYSAYTRGGRYGMTMCMSIARRLGMSEENIFKSVTSTPARVLGKANEWGYLKEGRCADIAVFDYTDEGFELTNNADNRLSSDMGYRCILTVSDGQVIYRY